MTTDAGARAVGSGVAAPADVAFVPCPLSHIPAPALDEYKQVFEDLDFDEDGLLFPEEVSAALRLNSVDITAAEMTVFLGAMSGGGQGPCIAFEAFATCLHALSVQHREVGDASVYSVFPDSDFTAEMATGWLRARRRVWSLIDDPHSSWAAAAVSVVIVVTIALSTCAFMAETVAAVRVATDGTALFDTIEEACVAVFTVELLARATCSPDRLPVFLSSPLNVVDIAAVLPFYIELAAAATPMAGAGSMAVLRVIRLARVARLMKIARYVTWMRVFTRTLSASVQPLLMLLGVTLLAVLTISSVEYFAERGEWDAARGTFVTGNGYTVFASIPQTFWWCIVTVTAVGYGDAVPITATGRFIAICTFFIGILLLAIPISVISSHFHDEFAHMTRLRALRAALAEQPAPAPLSGGHAPTAEHTVAATSSLGGVEAVGAGTGLDASAQAGAAATSAAVPPLGGGGSIGGNGSGDVGAVPAASSTAHDATAHHPQPPHASTGRAVAASLWAGISSVIGPRPPPPSLAALAAPGAAPDVAAAGDLTEDDDATPGGPGGSGLGGADVAPPPPLLLTAASSRAAAARERASWSEPFLRGSLQAVRQSRRRLMSALKNAELRNREDAVADVRGLIADLAVRDRARAVLARADAELRVGAGLVP